LSLNLKRLSSDFEQIYGHPIYLVETFVDESRYKGTCYKASNWKHVGYTQGYKRSNTRYYYHGIFKAVYLYKLFPKGREILLCGDLIPHDFTLLKDARRVGIMIKFPIESLLIVIKKYINDPRSGQGKRHPLESVLAIVVCAVLCGCRTYRSIGSWAGSLSREELIRFGDNRQEPPSEPTIRRIIQSINVENFDIHVGKWLLARSVLQNSQGIRGCCIAMDGKTLRGSHDGAQKAIHLLSAALHKEGVIIAQDKVDEKTNEIKHVKSNM
jgi:hypothetical protein